MAKKRLTRLFDHVADPTALTLAMARVVANGGAPGGDGETVGEFEARARRAIPQLVDELILGTYTPGPARRVAVAKRGGGVRVLTIPTVRDRVAQTAASRALMPGLEAEFDEGSYGYRPGRSVDQAVRKVDRLRRDGLEWAVDADIRACFDSIRHDLLIQRLEAHVDDRRFIDLISLWLEFHGGNTPGVGLPQGMPVSPVLANLHLDPLDEAFAGGAARIVRYADDFLLLAPTHADAITARDKAAKVLAKLGLELHPDKTRIVSFDQGLRFLGHLFVRGLVIADPDDEAPAYPSAVAADAEVDGPRKREGRPVPSKRVLYLATAGAQLKVGTGETLEAWEADELRLKLKPSLVARVEVHPGTTIAAPALIDLMAADVPVDFVDRHGRFLGSLAGRAGRHGQLHMAQARAVLDEPRRVVLARALVEARVHGHRALLRRLNRQKADPEVTHACEAINRVYRKLPGADTVASLMAYEGHSAKLYWPALGRLLPPGWTFERRGRRPAKTPFDVVLGALSTSLENDIAAAIHRVGLHPGFAVLHAVSDDEAALTADLMEPFRGPVAEACAVTLVAQKVISPEGFATDEAGLLIAIGDTQLKLIQGYERWMARPIKDAQVITSAQAGTDAGTVNRAETGVEVPWRELIARHVRRFAAAIEAGVPYLPYRMDY